MLRVLSALVFDECGAAVVPEDGNCQFHSLSHQLECNGVCVITAAVSILQLEYTSADCALLLGCESPYHSLVREHRRDHPCRAIPRRHSCRLHRRAGLGRVLLQFPTHTRVMAVLQLLCKDGVRSGVGGPHHTAGSLHGFPGVTCPNCCSQC